MVALIFKFILTHSCNLRDRLKQHFSNGEEHIIYLDGKPAMIYMEYIKYFKRELYLQYSQKTEYFVNIWHIF